MGSAFEKLGAFHLYAPISAFEKADAPEGQQRRIGGLVSTESRDRQNEIILQRGLDFTPFLQHGWFNDNHDKTPAGVIGEPDPTSLRYYQKGEQLPNGRKAPANGHWAEGWLLHGDPRADAIWSKIKSLEKSPTGRRFGFSIEGGVRRRAGPDLKTVAKAFVSHIAVTHVPVNTDAGLDALAKSLSAAHGTGLDVDDFDIHGIDDQDETDKAMTAGYGGAHDSPKTGTGVAAVLAHQDLEHDEVHKSGRPALLSGPQAIEYILARYPKIDFATAGRIVDLTSLLVRRRAGGIHG